MKRSSLLASLRKISLDDVRILEEKLDDQFKALLFLHKNLENKSSLPVLATLNALVSYQLSSTGEIYWWEFAKYFSRINVKNEVRDMINFLKNSRGNRRFLRVKVNRLKKLEGYVEYLRENCEEFFEDMETLRDFLSEKMNQKETDKTIVFAVKMFGYSMRISTKKFVPFPFTIAIPLDSRVERITRKITSENPISFWFKVSREINIPPLHIDSVLWNLSRRKVNSSMEKFKVLKEIRRSILHLISSK